MRYYTARISGRLIAQLFRNGVVQRFGDQVSVTEGLPENSTLLEVRQDGHDIMQCLFVSDEDGPQLPEAINVWEWADEITPNLTIQSLGDDRNEELLAEWIEAQK